MQGGRGSKIFPQPKLILPTGLMSGIQVKRATEQTIYIILAPHFQNSFTKISALI